MPADTKVCLPVNNRLVSLRLVTACEPVGLLAFEALVLLKHAVGALEKLFAGLQGLVDILQASQVYSGVCTLLSHRGHELKVVLKSCNAAQATLGALGGTRRGKHAH